MLGQGIPDRGSGADIESAPKIRIGNSTFSKILFGRGKLRERTFRIGHMGDHTVRGLTGCLAAIDRVLAAR